MSQSINVPIEMLSKLDFSIVEIECSDAEFNKVDYPAGEDAETGDVLLKTAYSRAATGRVTYSATYPGQSLSLSFDFVASANDKPTYKESFDVEVDPNSNTVANFVFVDDDGDKEALEPWQIENQANSFDDFRTYCEGILPVAENTETLTEEAMMKINYFLQNKETGSVIDEFQSLEAAQKALELFEEGDRNNNEYTEDFYEIVPMMDGSRVEEHVVSRDNATDLKFNGSELGYATSNDPYGNDNSRWFELTLYRTVGGKYVCAKKDISRWDGERSRYAADVCDDLDGVIAFFGHGWVSKDLYASAEIEDVELIE